MQRSRHKVLTRTTILLLVGVQLAAASEQNGTETIESRYGITWEQDGTFIVIPEAPPTFYYPPTPGVRGFELDIRHCATTEERIAKAERKVGMTLEEAKSARALFDEVVGYKCFDANLVDDWQECLSAYDPRVLAADNQAIKLKKEICRPSVGDQTEPAED